MINVGVIGLGSMGTTHLDVYSRRDDVTVVAVSDKNPDLLHGRSRAQGNIEGQARGGVDLSSAMRYDDGMDLIADERVQVVDICLPTPLHRSYGEAALAAGKHVMIEKPLARTAADALALAAAAERAPGVAMVGMCMRFWPAWVWLRETVAQRTYGRVLSAHFRRVAQFPGGPFYSNGDASGGALLDLHIHDTDFIHHCFGKPAAVYSRGHSTITNQPDHVVTQYLYDDPDFAATGSPLVFAEGGWAMAKGFGFKMQYTVNFERATALFDLSGVDGRKEQLVVETGGKPTPVDVPPGMGYEHEIAYFVDCIKTGRKPQTVSVRDAAISVQIVEAEGASIATGQVVRIQY